MSVKQLQKRKRMRKGRITYRKRKQKLMDGKIIEQFYAVGSETDVSIDCPPFELPHALVSQQRKETTFQEDFLSKMCVPHLLTSKEMVSRMEQLNFVEIKSVSDRIEYDENENEELGLVREGEGFSKCCKRKRMKMNKRKAVSDSLAPSDTDSNEELSIEATSSTTQAILQSLDTPLYSPTKYSHAPQPHNSPCVTSGNTSYCIDLAHRDAATHLDADDEESTFEAVLSNNTHRPLSPDVAMKDLSVQLRNKERRNLLRDPGLVNSIITQFVESSQNQLAISTRIDKFGFRIIRCLSLAHGVKVKLLEHCHFGWCPLLVRTARSSVGDRGLLDPMLELLREESRQLSRRQRPRKVLLPDSAPVSAQ